MMLPAILKKQKKSEEKIRFRPFNLVKIYVASIIKLAYRILDYKLTYSTNVLPSDFVTIL